MKTFDKLTITEYRELVAQRNAEAEASRKWKKSEKPKRDREVTEVQIPFVVWVKQYFFPKYPGAIMIVDALADIQKMPPRLKAKTIDEAKLRGWNSNVDVLLLQPTPNGAFPGIALELKVHDAYIYKKDGSVRKDKQLQKEYERIIQYRDLGYYADFFCGLPICQEVMRQLYKI